MKFEFCLPTLGKRVPASSEWFHEIKYDGYRLRVQRDGESVRLVTRGGYDWTKRYPWIVEAALKNRQKRFVIDGDSRYRSGRSKDWIKVKNRAHPAFDRVKEAFA
jgi:bifunctional non-homologous end joining protein LigD